VTGSHTGSVRDRLMSSALFSAVSRHSIKLRETLASKPSEPGIEACYRFRAVHSILKFARMPRELPLKAARLRHFTLESSE
jgi:hypothetical protein